MVSTCIKLLSKYTYLNTYKCFIMKWYPYLLISIAWIALNTSAFSQSKTDKQVLRQILNEKFHFKNPVKLSVLLSGRKTMEQARIGLRESKEYKMTSNTSRLISEGEPMVAVDPNNPDRIVIGFMELGIGSLDMPVYHSEDGGLTWSKSSFSTMEAIGKDEETRRGLLLGGGDPVLAYDPDGRLLYSYISYTGGISGNKFICWLASSDDNGASFKLVDAQKFLARAKFDSQQNFDLNYGNGLLDRQWLVIDHSDGSFRGRQYLSGLYIPIKSGAVMPQIGLLYRNSSEEAFPEDIRTVTQADLPQFAHIIVDGKGTLHLVYVTIHSGEMFYQNSTDGGESFSQAYPVTQTLTYNKQSIVKAVQQRENPMPNIAANNDGSVLWASWTDFKDNEAHAYINRSTDGGKTWQRAYNVDDLSDFGDYSLMPTISVNSEEDLVVSWFAVNDALDGQFTVAVKLHDSDRFEVEPIFVSGEVSNFKKYKSDQSIFFGDYLNSATSGTKTYSVFSDGRDNKGPKLYLATTDHKGLSTEIVEINTKPLEIESISPQPASDYITLRLNKYIKKPIEVRWLSANGSVIDRTQTASHEGKLKLQIPPVCSEGVFFVNLEIGNLSLTGKVLVER